MPQPPAVIDRAAPAEAPRPADVLLERIDTRLAEIDKTRYWLSLQVTDGKSTRVFTDIARTGYLPKEARMRRIAEVLGLNLDYLMLRSNHPGLVHSEVGVSDRILEWHGPERGVPGIPLVGTGDCADLEVCDQSGHLASVERSSFDPDYHVRYLQRPPALSGAKDIYAIYFHGSSMEPRFEPGEIGIVDPRRHAGPGNYVLVQLRPDTCDEASDEVVSVLVKRLVRQNSNEIVLEQFNPPLIFSVPRARVAHVHRIMRHTDLLF